MAQHPNKLRWKEVVPHGLSASQFGAALGFCGRVSDYVDYERHIVGTELAFSGNSFTAHGILTEPKSRALYELLTGHRVYSGGFFVSHAGLLGCSPDGRIFFDDDGTRKRSRSHSSGRSDPATTPESSTTPNITRPPPLVTSFKIPFCRPRIPLVAQSSAGKTLDEGRLDISAEDYAKILFWGQQQKRRKYKKRVRLLEIKSPVRKLYGGKGTAYQPFGIPQHYMCQMQGQMAIADADECDFFGFVDRTSQVEAWRVKRSIAFWEWAEPKLLQVTDWIKDGPPEWLNRSFSFESFDFSTLSVQPLVFPYDIAMGSPLNNPIAFPYFHQFDCPYSQISSSDAPATEIERIAKMVQSPVTFQLFGLRTEEEDGEEASIPETGPITTARFYIGNWKSLLQALRRTQDHGMWDMDDYLHVEGPTEARVQMVDIEEGRILIILSGEGQDIGSFYIHCYDRDVLSQLSAVSTLEHSHAHS
eukprot:gene13276-9118_t